MNPTLAAAHRSRFLDAMEGGVAVLPTGPELIRSRDTHFPFRPQSDFWYLTAFPEPDAVAVLIPDRDEGRFVLFVRPRDKEMEIWNGRRAGVEGARELYGADEAHPIEALDTELPKLLRGADKLFYATGHDADFDRRLLSMVQGMNARSRDGVLGPLAVVDPATILHEMRLHKSDDEVGILRRAAAITDEAHRAAMQLLEPGLHEYAVEAVVNGTFRRRGGWGPGYTTIAASGDNANVLHYTTNDAVVAEGSLMLLDAGCELDGYTADVTRCFPASGRFTEAQRELYEVVLAAEEAAVAAVAPGVTFDAIHETALRRLVEGLVALELLPGSVDEVLEGGSYRQFFMHRTSHWLGLDVHDVGLYHTADGASRPLEPGMVLTVEPGLYVAADSQGVPERFLGTGIRIEDDVLVTADGHENLTAAVPKTIADVEAAC